MLTLNLVSKELREDIKSKHIYNLLKKICLLIITVSIFISIILLSAKIMMQNNFNKIVEQTTLVTGTSSSYNQKVNTINSKISSVKNIQNNYIALSYLIESLSKITPNSLSYSMMEINIEEKKMELRGSADDRDDLLAIKKGLGELGVFENIESPIQNILQKKDINFQINANINIDALKESIGKTGQNKPL